ncbi:MAG TPA: proprotein convertase P-domain-containing protein [Thermoanaerobaculia bacterium]|nr:proprotein convertase P-domain-containing protein [Thermoanaerobaculia bacterium]HUM29751.1 proprotein convertase P-domain-containing protein [Thermoanaerobaculia bacterium]HXK67051.1 proprotein convertase P-domain-containing protein [Thermoanaerobaculia bacterium]
MRIKRSVISFLFLVVSSVGLFGFTPKNSNQPLDQAVYSQPEMRVVRTISRFSSIEDRLNNGTSYRSMMTDLGPSWYAFVDERTGRPSLIEGGAIPWIPGPANDFSFQEFMPGCQDVSCIPLEKVDAMGRAFLASYPDVFKAGAFDLMPSRDGSGPVGSSIYFLRYFVYYKGIPVQGAYIDFRLNGGNLIQVAMDKVADINLSTIPQVSLKNAWDVLYSYLGELPSKYDHVIDPGTLMILPITPRGKDPDAFNGAIGTGLSYTLAYRLQFTREGQVGTWEALIDAHTGEILHFVDVNRYGKVHGVVYPGDGHNNAADRPMPFVLTNLPSPDEYASAGGLFPGDNATVSFSQGKYTWVNDSCGSTDLTTTTGDADYQGSGAETDCETPSPNPGEAGNTMSARTQYYHLTMVNIKARSYHPTNTWLTTSHMNVNVNQASWCNATSGGGTLNFYQSDPANDCWNLGELPGVSLHEWGHSWDDNDGAGMDSPPLETRADWTATLQTHDSCCGRGAFTSGNCGGYGDACLDCSGIRDGDYTKHANNTPWTAANHGTFWNCSGGSYFGPCGLEDHCESGISTQALWEFVHTDLPNLSGIDVTSAWQLEDRLFYVSHPQLGDMYNCSPPDSDGCGGVTLYTLMRAIDDDGDGVGNGTPHAEAIFASLDRHNIACGNASDLANQNQTTCPSFSPNPPTLSSAAGSNSAVLTWASVANATRYFLYRNETDCDAGFTRIATINAPATSYTDTTVVNGLTYFYRLQAASASDSCTSGMSNCEAVTPQPCAGAVSLDRSTYNCSDTISIHLLDSDISGTGSYDVTVWSDSEGNSGSPAETVTLSESPANSGQFQGTVLTSTSTGGGDGAVGIADGDTITVRYVDASYCGIPDVNVDATSSADCIGPVISNVQATNVMGTTATITWDTDEISSSVVYVAEFPPSWTTTTDTLLVTGHTVDVSGLSECTLYYYWVESTDAAGNTTYEDNTGSYYTFTTGVNVQPTYTATDTPVTIVDNASVFSTIAVPDNKVVMDVNVTLTITHTYDSDLDIYLRGPDGTEVELSTDNGGSSDNYTNTTFDDEAATPITSGTAPFTGIFRPEGLLSILDGKIAQGNWQLRVYDDAGGDTGSIESWSLTLSYPAQSCGPHASYSAHTLVLDSCSAGGPGDDDTIWDAGEQVQFSMTIYSDGTDPITGVSATITPLTPGVTMVDDTAAYNNLPTDTTGVSQSPHFIVQLPDSLSCGDVVDFQVEINTNEGTWTDTFSQGIGQTIPGGFSLLSENFEGVWGPYGNNPPAGWTIEDHGSQTPAVWDNNDWHNYAKGGAYGAVARVYYSPTETQNEYLITPAFDIPWDATTVSLQFDHYYQDWDTQDFGYVDYSSDQTSWTTLVTYSATTADMAHATLSLLTYAGETNARIRFRYVGYYGWQWQVDNVTVSGTRPSTCNMNICEGTCTYPSAPAITDIQDGDACAQSGITITYTAGTPAIRHDLYDNGSLAVSGFLSGGIYNPGDSASHSYTIRAINGAASCYTESPAQAGQDTDDGPGTPVILSIVDNDVCLQTGITINFTAAPNSPDRHDLYVDGGLEVSGFTSGSTYNPGDSLPHTYVIQAIKGSCTIDSASQSFSDAAGPCAPRIMYTSGSVTFTQVEGDADTGAMNPGEKWHLSFQVDNVTGTAEAILPAYLTISANNGVFQDDFCINPVSIPDGNSDGVLSVGETSGLIEADLVIPADWMGPCPSDIEFGFLNKVHDGGSSAGPNEAAGSVTVSEVLHQLGVVVAGGTSVYNGTLVGTPAGDIPDNNLTAYYTDTVSPTESSATLVELYFTIVHDRIGDINKDGFAQLRFPDSSTLALTPISEGNLMTVDITTLYQGDGDYTLEIADGKNGKNGYVSAWRIEVRTATTTDCSAKAAASCGVMEPSRVGSSFPLQVISKGGNAVEVEKVAGATAYNVYIDAINDWYSPDDSGASVCTITSWTDNGDTVILDVIIPPDHWVTVSASNASGESSCGQNSDNEERMGIGTWPTCPLP